MKCEHSEELLALYIEGELNAGEADALTRHLRVCSDCVAVTGGLKESQEAVKALRADSVNPVAMTRLHRKIMDQVVEQKRSPEWWRSLERTLFFGLRWKYAVAGIAGAFAIGSLLILQQQTPQPVVSVATESPRTAELLLPDELKRTDAPTVAVAPRRQTPARKPPATTPEEPPRQIMVKLFTDDPHIVIYWSIDGNGETQ